MYAGGLIPATNMHGALGRPSSSETNIHRMLQMTKPHRELPMARPGSALAMLQGEITLVIDYLHASQKLRPKIIVQRKNEYK